MFTHVPGHFTFYTASFGSMRELQMHLMRINQVFVCLELCSNSQTTNLTTELTNSKADLTSSRLLKDNIFLSVKFGLCASYAESNPYLIYHTAVDACLRAQNLIIHLDPSFLLLGESYRSIDTLPHQIIINIAKNVYFILQKGHYRLIHQPTFP